MNLLEIQNGTKIYLKENGEKVVAFSDLDITVKKGESLAILGRSGAGKSTLIHILGCLDRLTKGTYLLEGKDIGKATAEELAHIRNKKIGFIMQNFGLINGKSVYENVATPLHFNPAICKKEIKERIEKVIIDMGLAEKQKTLVANLTNAQKQRVAIARALVNDSELVLADEPTGSLEREASEEIMDLLMQVHAQGHTLIVATNNIYLAEKCERQYVIK